MGLEQLAGNRSLKDQLLPRLAAGSLGHAYILSGPGGCGKRTLAGILAQALVCGSSGERPCGACPACKKARMGIHPDISAVSGGEGKAITVDQVRALRSDAFIRPNEAQRKVYILEDAGSLNPNAQNAMLKLLEEGPPYAAFLLLAENPGALLPTVRSRCEELALAPVSVPQAEQWLAGRFPDKSSQERRQAALDCQGLLGRAAELLSGAGEEDAAPEEAARAVHGAFLSGDEAAMMAACVPLEKWDRRGFTAFLSRLSALFSPELTGPGRRKALRAMQLVDELRRAAELNAGPGHLAGWLCAGLWSISSGTIQIN